MYVVIFSWELLNGKTLSNNAYVFCKIDIVLFHYIIRITLYIEEPLTDHNYYKQFILFS